MSATSLLLSFPQSKCQSLLVAIRPFLCFISLDASVLMRVRVLVCPLSVVCRLSIDRLAQQSTAKKARKEIAVIGFINVWQARLNRTEVIVQLPDLMQKERGNKTNLGEGSSVSTAYVTTAINIKFKSLDYFVWSHAR